MGTLWESLGERVGVSVRVVVVAWAERLLLDQPNRRHASVFEGEQAAGSTHDRPPRRPGRIPAPGRHLCRAS